MKKFSVILIFITSIFMLGACGSSSSSSSDEDDYSAEAAELIAGLFLDEAFETCVQDAVAEGISSTVAAGGAIADYTLGDLALLSCQNLGIADISGIDNLTGLTSLNLNGNGLEDDDITALTGLSTLWYLNLADNALVAPDLSAVDSLASVDLSGNVLTSLTLFSEAELHSLALGEDADISLSDVTYL